MKKLLRIFRTAVIVLAVVLLLAAVGAWAAWRWWAPGMIEQQLRTELAAAGFPAATFTLAGLQLDRVTLTDVSLTRDRRLTADRIVAEAGGAGLLAGRLDRLAIRGARWRVTLADGAIDHGLPPQLFAGGRGDDVPVDRIELTDCAVELTHGEHAWTIPIVPASGGRPVEIVAEPVGIRYDASRHRLTLHRPPHRDLPGDPVPALLAAHLPGVSLDAGLGATVHVGLNGEIEGRAFIENGSVKLDTPESTFTAVSAELRFAGPHWRTTDHPRLRWESATLGNLELGPGVVQWQYRLGQPLFIERAHVRLGQEGQLWAHAVQIDPAKVDLAVNLFWESIALSDFLNIVAPRHVEGRGVLHGRLPIRVRTQPTLKLTFGQGYLLAESDGRISVKDPDFARRILGPQLQQAAAAATDRPDHRRIVERRIVHALQAFQYQRLKLVSSEQDEMSVLAVEIRGFGQVEDERTGRPVRQELNLTVNFEGIGGLVDIILRAQLAMAAAEEKIRAGLEDR